MEKQPKKQYDRKPYDRKYYKANKEQLMIKQRIRRSLIRKKIKEVIENVHVYSWTGASPDPEQ